MPKMVLSVDGMSAGYGAVTVLRDISFGVAQGSVTGIIGPNGHGKSTLINAISGFVRVTGGQIQLDGDRVDGLPPFRIVERGIVQIPQGDLIFPDLTILENLHVGAYLEPSSEVRKTSLDEIFSILPKLAERRLQVASTLSGGERRMLAIGRGLMTKSRVLMIDEPSLGLAPIVIDQIYKVLFDLKKDGRTILLVEENPDRMMDFADQVLLVDNGAIVWRGAPGDMQHLDGMLETYLGV
jgi:branched-chain amino acid transport system ATP-binding protein